jgi:hypothetical protein
MLILQVLLLWLIVSALMTGGAMLFHRFYPEDSPWLGFLVPPLAFVALFNFLEHLVALPGLLILLPLLLGGTLWMAVAGNYFKPALILPTAVFLACFAFTLGVRCIAPDIMATSDGVSDLNMINNFLQGQTLPPPDTWMPPFHFVFYYDLQHYAASLVERLLGVDIGHADNVSHALLNALIPLAAAGAAHRLSGEKLFATLATPFLILCASTGSAAYLVLICHSTDVWLSADLSSGMVKPPDANPIWGWLANDLPAALHGKTPDQILDHQTLRLQVPGFWTWRDEYHANASGHLLTILSVLVVAELAAARRTTWPWVLGAIMPMLAATASAWALPITTLLCWAMLPAAWYLGRRPAALNASLWTLFGSVVLLWPAFFDVTSNPHVPDITWIDPLDRVPPLEFLVQWWPIILLWICGACILAPTLRAIALERRAGAVMTARASLRHTLSEHGPSVGLGWFLIVVPLMLGWIETVTIESRYNMIEKMWGYTWAVGLVGLFPIIASRVNPFFRLVSIILVAYSSVSLYAFLHNITGGSWDAATFHLEGDRYLTHDDQKKRLLDVFGQYKRAVFLTGVCDYCYYESPALATFTGNQSYSAWYWFESNANNPDEAQVREKQNNDFYSGAMTDRLEFLRNKNITGVLIWPGDNITDDALAKLKQDLAPDYDYIDCKGEGSANAGVFVKKR